MVEISQEIWLLKEFLLYILVPFTNCDNLWAWLYFKHFFFHFRIIVVQSENAIDEDNTDSEQTGTIKASASNALASAIASSSASEQAITESHESNQGVNLYILAGHENMQL